MSLSAYMNIQILKIALKCIILFKIDQFHNGKLFFSQMPIMNNVNVAKYLISNVKF